MITTTERTPTTIVAFWDLPSGSKNLSTGYLSGSRVWCGKYLNPGYAGLFVATSWCEINLVTLLRWLFTCRLHDRKIFVLGLCTLLSMTGSRPQILSDEAPRLLPSLILVFKGLKRAYERKISPLLYCSSGSGSGSSSSSRQNRLISTFLGKCVVCSCSWVLSKK